jgi:hypothetical protein
MDGRWARGDESPDGIPRFPNRYQPRIDEGHVGCLSRKDGGKSRRTVVCSCALGSL